MTDTEMMKRFTTISIVVLILAMSLGTCVAGGAALAGDLATADLAPPSDGFIDAVITAASGAQWLALGALALGGIVWLIRRESGWLRAKWSWLGTDRGGALLALLIGAIAEVATSLTSQAHAPLGTTGALLASLAAGGRALLRGLIFPKKGGAP